MFSLEWCGGQLAWYVLLPKKGEHEGSHAPQPADQNNQSIENFLQHQHVFSPCWYNMLLPSLQVNSAWTWHRLTPYPRTSQNVKVSSLEAQKHAIFFEAELYAFAWCNQKFTLSSLQHNSFYTVISPSFWCSPSLPRVQPCKTLEVLNQELAIKLMQPSILLSQ